jgi:hypothetical protein
LQLLAELILVNKAAAAASATAGRLSSFQMTLAVII